MNQTIILIRFAELTLKGKNRSEFENKLVNNLKVKFAPYQCQITKDHNRIYISDLVDDHISTITQDLKLIPGISSYSVAQKISNDLEHLKTHAQNYFTQNYQQGTIAVKVKRTNKRYPLNSNQVEIEVASHILKHSQFESIKVNLKKPDYKISIEIHHKYAYLFDQTIKGAGGLPIGSSGKGFLLLSGGIDSPVAAYEMMKRGLKVECLHFESPPYTNNASLEKVKSIVKTLSQFDPNIKLHVFSVTAAQLLIRDNCDNRYNITLLRRVMFKVAAAYADLNHVKCLITGESLGQVASQTIESINVVNHTTNLPIFRPLISHDKETIISVAKIIKTYEISIQPHADCCTLFVPPNPIIKPKLENVIQEELKIESQVEIKGIIEQVKIITPSDYQNQAISQYF